MSSMTESILPEDHIIFRACEEIQAICDPFFKSSGLNFFVFNRTYKTDYMPGQPMKGFCLFNDVAWAEHFFKHDYRRRISLLGVNEVGQFSGYKVLFFNLFEDNAMLHNLRDYFSYDHGVLIVKQHKDYAEWYTFATSKDKPQMLSYYLNHFEELIQFILYFKHKASHLLKKAEGADFPMPPPEYKLVNNLGANEVLFSQEGVWQNANKHFILFGDTCAELTPREKDCLQYLRQGFSAKLIARELSISPRTVEDYVRNIYQKLDCHSKAELLQKLKN